MRRALVLVLALLLGGALVGTPAQATSSHGSVTGVNGVLYDDCLTYPYRYDVSVPSGSASWGLSATLIGPDGRSVDSDYVPEPTSGSSTFGLLCPSAQGYGRYTIHASVAWGTGAVPDQSASLADAHFTLRKPRSHARVTASARRPAYGQVVRYRVTAYDERPAGYRPRAFAWVHLEQRQGGHWVRIDGGRAMTHDTGTVVIGLRYRGHHRTLKLRAVTETSARFTRSTSPVLRLW